MNIHHRLVSLGCLAALGLTGAWAKSSPSEFVVLKGTAQVKQADGSWADTNKLTANAWVRPASGNATLRLPGMTVRLEEGASLNVGKASSGAANLQARGGRVYFKVDADSAGCYIATNTKRVHAAQSEFILDAGTEEKLYVLDGQASILNDETTAVRDLEAWVKPEAKEVALDGPDVRRRNRNRRRFTQGEENKGKRIGEDQPPSTPRVVETQTPAYTPSATPTFSPSPSVTPTPSPSPQPPQVVDGGFNPWPLIGGIAGAGGIAALVILNNDDDDDRRIVFPASP